MGDRKNKRRVTRGYLKFKAPQERNDVHIPLLRSFIQCGFQLSES
jgi:hypothetical protein